jgi:hypothetical protein
MVRGGLSTQALIFGYSPGVTDLLGAGCLGLTGNMDILCGVIV